MSRYCAWEPDHILIGLVIVLFAAIITLVIVLDSLKPDPKPPPPLSPWMQQQQQLECIKQRGEWTFRHGHGFCWFGH